jgi:lysyl-tRNA synthetase, class II
MRHGQSLNSSALSSAQYDDETRELELTFSSGQTYTYHDVPKDVYDGLVSSSSPGRYYNEAIKDIYQ